MSNQSFIIVEQQELLDIKFLANEPETNPKKLCSGRFILDRTKNRDNESREACLSHYGNISICTKYGTVFTAVGNNLKCFSIFDFEVISF